MSEQSPQVSTKRPLCPRLIAEAEVSFFTEELSTEMRQELVRAAECPANCKGPERIAYSMLGGKALLHVNIGKDICSYISAAIPEQATASPNVSESVVVDMYKPAV